jgi:uncharacterized membrane protein
VEDDNCPHCGKSVRNTTYLVAGGVLGLVIFVSSLFNIGELAVFGVLGLFLTASSGYLLYNKRQRIKDASEVAAENTQVTVENN